MEGWVADCKDEKNRSIVPASVPSYELPQVVVVRLHAPVVVMIENIVGIKNIVGIGPLL